MPEPQLLVDHGEQVGDRAALVRRHPEVEQAGEVHGAQILLPGEEHPVVAPASTQLDHHLLVGRAVEAPFVGGDQFFEDVQRIGLRRGLLSRDDGHRHALLGHPADEEPAVGRIGCQPIEGASESNPPYVGCQKGFGDATDCSRNFRVRPSGGGAGPSPAAPPGPDPRQASLQRRHPALQRHLLGARLGGHRLDRGKLLAAHQVHAAEQPLGLLAQLRLELVAQARDIAGGTGEEAREVVEKAVFALHACKLPWRR